MPKLSKAFALIGLLALAGCEKPDNAPGPGNVSMGEARALDRAAEIIEERAVQVPEPEAAPAPAPAPELTEADAQTAD